MIEPYISSSIARSDQELTSLLFSEFNNLDDLKDRITKGINLTADSFYGSQGRIDDNFIDENIGIIDKLSSQYENAQSMEMETFQLLHLAYCSKTPIFASSAAIVVANRRTGNVIDGDTLNQLEISGGRAILEAITKLSL